jgi:hypothetical protein
VGLLKIDWLCTLPVLLPKMLMKNVKKKDWPMWMKFLARPEGIHPRFWVMSTKKHEGMNEKRG